MDKDDNVFRGCMFAGTLLCIILTWRYGLFLYGHPIIMDGLFQIVQSGFTACMLTPKRDFKTSFGILWLAEQVCCYANYYVEAQGYVMAKVLIMTLTQMIVCVWVFREETGYKLLFIVFQTSVVAVSELSMVGMLSLMRIPLRTTVANPWYRSFGLIVITTIFSIPASALIWWRRRKTLQISTKTAYTFLFFMIGELLTVWVITLSYWYVENDLLAFVSVAATVILLVSTFFVLRTLVALERAARLEQHLQEMRTSYQLQLSDYEAMKERNREIAKAEHDYKNQLSTLLTLLQNGETAEAALELTRQLKARIIQPEKIFCENYIVNAVLTNKEQTCFRQGIRLNCSVWIPEQIPIEAYHLCSICSNLLDNAIRAVSALKEQERCIEFHGKMEGQHLIIRVTNPYDPTAELHGSGYGQEILKDIAREYEGELIVQSSGRQYNAILYI